MIEVVAAKLAAHIKQAIPDHPRSEAVLAFSISFILNTVLIIVFSLIISLFTGRIMETITVLLSYAVLRQISGGHHLKSGGLCILVSTVGVSALSFSNFGHRIIFMMNILSLILVLIYSPSQLEGTRIPIRYYPMLKILSALVVCVNFFLQSSLVAASFLVQSLTLINLRKMVRT